MWRVREVSTRTTLKASTQPLLSVSRVLMAGQLLATGPRHNSTAHKVIVLGDFLFLYNTSHTDSIN